MQRNVAKWEKFKMPSNVPIGKNEKNSKCAAMCPLEIKLRTSQNTQQCGHWKKIDKN